jgi:uncharacterized protein (DUF488 family)
MEIYTIGFTQRRAEAFFEALKQAGVHRVMDVRLHNTSQLAGFTRREDLPYFLSQICGADYIHEPLLAPTVELLGDYRKRLLSWDDYERGFLGLMADREVQSRLDPQLFRVPTALLCSEPTPEHCHRRLVLEYLETKWGNLAAVHL